MVRRSLILSCCLTVACASERVDEAKQPAQKTEAPTNDREEPPSEPPPVSDPPAFEGSRVRVSGPLPFSLELGDSGMSGDRAGDGDYLTLSGPPGGPLMLRIYPATVGADLEKLVTSLRPDATLTTGRVTLLGTERPAVSWITGESMARTLWCGVIVARPDATPGQPALLLEFGVGHQGEGGDCKTAREHHVLASVLDSLVFEST